MYIQHKQQAAFLHSLVIEANTTRRLLRLRMLHRKCPRWLKTFTKSSTTTHGTHGGKIAEFHPGMKLSPVSCKHVGWICTVWSFTAGHTHRGSEKCHLGPGQKRVRVFTWSFDPGMKFHPGAEDWDEIIPGWTNFTPGSCKHQETNNQSPRWNSSRDEFTHVNRPLVCSQKVAWAEYC